MLTFVFLDYKSAGATVACISHYIQKCKNSSEELSFVVVDNSVDDENFEKLSMSWKTVTACEYEGSILEEKLVDGYRLFLWKNTVNAGYAKGNNSGAKIAAEFLKSDYLLFTNNDLVVLDEELSLEALIREASIPQVGAVGPSIVGKNLKSQNPYFDKSFFLRWGLEYLCYPLNRFLPQRFRSSDLLEKFVANPVFRVMGSFFVVSRKKFEEAGGFDPHTFLFAEEMILAKKMQKAGYEMHYLPTVHLLHNHSEIINKKYNELNRLALKFESECYYYKNYGDVGAFQMTLVKIIFKSYVIRKKIVKKIKELIQ